MIDAALERSANAWRKSAMGRWWRYDCRLVIWRAERPAEPADPVDSDLVGRNRREHLERFVAAERRIDRDAFLRTCEQRLAAGERVYTICPGEALLAYAWMVPNQEQSWLSAVKTELRYPPRSCVMYNAYTVRHARGRGYNTLLTRARVADAFLRFGAHGVFTAVEAGSEFAERAKLATGFRPWMEFTLRTRLGRSTRTERRLCIERDRHEPLFRGAAAAFRPGSVATGASTGPNPPGT